MRGTGHQWRWNRGPLCRSWEVKDAWLGLVSLLVLLLVVPAVGYAAGHALYEARASVRQEQLADLHPVRGKLLEETFAPTPHTTDGFGRVPARARWHTADDRAHTGVITVRTGLPKGAAVTVWLTEAERPAPAPEPPDEARDSGIAAGLITASVAALAVLGLRGWLRSRLDAGRLAAWEYEWELVGPRWRSGQT